MNMHKLVMLVLSCDGYSDLWDDFFNLKEKYWPDCPYDWYVVTESQDYSRIGVEVIKCGKDLDWAGRLRYAIHTIDSKYYGIYLEDYFISAKVDSSIISELLDVMDNNAVTYINTSDVFYSIISMREKEYFQKYLIKIPNDKKYGLSTESGIWEKSFLLSKLGNNDYSAWQFEIDRVLEAASSEGLGGFNLCDERMPFHVSVKPVVIQGKIYPAARRFFARQGYSFLTKRENMTIKQVLIFKLKMKMSNVKHGKKLFKWMATNFLGVKFFT